MYIKKAVHTLEILLSKTNFHLDCNIYVNIAFLAFIVLISGALTRAPFHSCTCTCWIIIEHEK